MLYSQSMWGEVVEWLTKSTSTGFSHSLPVAVDIDCKHCIVPISSKNDLSLQYMHQHVPVVFLQELTLYGILDRALKAEQQGEEETFLANVFLAGTHRYSVPAPLAQVPAPPTGTCSGCV